MKKKTYEKPQFEAFEVEAADIIATSGNIRIGDGDGILIGEEEW